MLELRQNLADREWREAAIVEKLLGMAELRKAKVVALYWPIRGEVNLLSVRKRINAKVCLPKVVNEGLRFGYWRDDCIKPGSFGIPEPVKADVMFEDIDVFCVPALALDYDGYRLGYGGGYYDRLIKEKLPHQLFVGVVFSVQLVEALPRKDWDAPVDVVLTEEHLIYPLTSSKLEKGGRIWG